MRSTLLKAQNYQRDWQDYERDLKLWKAEQGIQAEADYSKVTKKPPRAPSVDLEMETLKGVFEQDSRTHPLLPR